MNLNIDDIIPGLTLFDKDNLIYAKGDEIVNLALDDIEDNDIFNKIVHTVAIFNNMNGYEEDIYTTIIKDIIADNYEMKDSIVFDINENFINRIRIINRASASTIRRNINSLIDKQVIYYYTDNNGLPIPGKYILKDKYDITKYFKNLNDIKYILIKI